MKTTIINLFGGAGAGKSTLMAFLYAHIKSSSEFPSIEMCQEFAKLLVLQGRTSMLDNQHYVTDNQIRMVKPFLGNVPLVVTDSPLLLGKVYAKDSQLKKEIAEKINNALCGTNEINIFVKRNGIEFEQFGRVHTLEESMTKDEEIIQMLKAENKEVIIYDRTIDTIDDLLIKIHDTLSGFSGKEEGFKMRTIISDNEDGKELGFYFERSNGNVQFIKVNKKELIESEAEKLLETYPNGAYCSFGNKLDEKNFEILKNLGVSTYIGIMARYENKEELDDFNVTEEEMSAFNKLICC